LEFSEAQKKSGRSGLSVDPFESRALIIRKPEKSIKIHQNPWLSTLSQWAIAGFGDIDLATLVVGFIELQGFLQGLAK